MATNNSVNTPLSGTTGSGNFVGSTSPTLTTPNIGNTTLATSASASCTATFPNLTGTVALSGASQNVTFGTVQTSQINDTNGKTNLAIGAAANAVNYMTSVNSATGGYTGFEVAGSDTNANAYIKPKGDAGLAVITSAVTTAPFAIFSGTAQQHITAFSFANTAATRAVTFPDATGTVAFNSVAYGGTGVTSTTAYAVLCGGTTSTGALQSVASVGTAGQVLTSNGAGALPTFQSLAASSSAYVLISTGTASSSASIDFTGLSTTYSAYKIIYNNLYPGTTNTQFVMLFSTNNGSSFITSAYQYAGMAQGTGSYAAAASTNSSSILLSNSAAFYTTTNTVGAGEITLFNPAGSQATKLISHTGAGYAGSPLSPVTYTTMGAYVTASAVNAVRLQMSSGNIGTGTFKLYGILA